MQHVIKTDPKTGQFKSYTVDDVLELMTKKTTIEDRGYETPCWICKSGKQERYGRVCINYQYQDMHRFAYKIFCGEIPEGKCVLHHCDQKPCWRPSHLFIGTKKINNEDRHAKGRDAKGEQSGVSILTATKILEIRRRYPAESQQKLSEAFNTSQTNISAIVRRITWNDI